MMNLIYSNISKIRPIRWLIATSICLLLVIFSPLPAFATVTQIEEAPGQMLYQSRQNLRDRTGKSWQVVAFKRVRPDGSAMISLRLVGFLGAVELDHTQPLTLTTSMGQTLTAKDVTSGISQGATALANVGEYDIQPVLPQLQSKISLQLTLAKQFGCSAEAVRFRCPDPVWLGEAISGLVMSHWLAIFAIPSAVVGAIGLLLSWILNHQRSRTSAGISEQPPATFYRSRRHKVIAGVCSALAQRWHQSLPVIRIVAVVLAIVTPGFIFLYLWCWLAFPLEPQSPQQPVGAQS